MIIESRVFVPDTTDGEAQAEKMGIEAGFELITARITFHMKDVTNFFEYSTNNKGEDYLLGKSVVHFAGGESFIIDMFYSRFKIKFEEFHAV